MGSRQKYDCMGGIGLEWARFWKNIRRSLLDQSRTKSWWGERHVDRIKECYPL
jgi:hypothetical protein